jgi:hypothetical protein
MSELKKLIDKRWLAIGKPLPFSIYDSHRKLLLAQGHVVESARSLERLLEHGHYYRPDRLGGKDAEVIEEAIADPPDPVSPLTALNRDYANIPQRARCGIKISPRETGDSYFCWVIGASHENRCLVMTAPARPDKALAPISKGQVWYCRMFSSTSVFRFRGAILKVAFEPYPYVHILVPDVIERRLVRHLPRALVSLQATLSTPDNHHVSIVDISVGGARIGAEKKLVLEEGQAVQLAMTIDVLGRPHDLCLQAKVAKAHGMADARHPRVVFYGVSFDELDERGTLMLHAYVQQQLAREHDGLGQVLALANPDKE